MKKRKLLIQIDWSGSSTTSIFKDVANYVGNMLEYYLSDVESEKLKKIVATATDEADFINLIPQDLKSDVVIIYKTFDFEEFNIASFEKKKRLVFEFAYDILQMVFEKLELDLQTLKNCRAQILKTDFNFIRIIDRKRFNKSRTVKSLVAAEYFIGYTLISITFFNNKNIILNKIDLFRTLPHWFMFLQVTSTAKWIDDNSLLLSSKNGGINIVAKVDGSVSLVYPQLAEDIKLLKEKIKLLTQEMYFDF